MIFFHIFSHSEPGKPAPPPYVNENATIINVNFMLPEEGYVGGLPDNFTIFYYPKGNAVHSLFHFKL